MDHSPTIQQIENKLDQLLIQHEEFNRQIMAMQKEVEHLKHRNNAPSASLLQKVEPEKEQPFVAEEKIIQPAIKKKTEIINEKKTKSQKPSAEWEQFIGGNLINKVGIVILLIGLGLFVQYAADKGLLPPPVRVVMGYFSGFILLGFANRFREKYEKYSAVLFSGGMAVLYFTTYLGYAFFEPPVLAMLLAFYLMLTFTVVTIIIANYFKSEIIGIIGLVGAYAVPLLVNDNTGNVPAFFLFVTIINAGILFISVRNNWRLTSKVAFVVSWLIFFSTWILSNQNNYHVPFAFFTVLLNFMVFYTAFVFNGLKSDERSEQVNFLFLALNAAFFYFISIAMLQQIFETENWSGVWAAVQAVFHFIAGYFILRMYQKANIFWFLNFIAVLFLIVAIPLEFEIKGIIIGWFLISIGLFYISKRFKKSAFEIISFVLLALALFYTVGDWSVTYYEPEYRISPIFNGLFFNQVFLVGGFGIFYLINDRLNNDKDKSVIKNFISHAILFSIFLLFFNELFNYLKPVHWSAESGVPLGESNQMMSFRIVALLIYSMVFCIVMGFLNLKKFRYKFIDNLMIYGGILLLILFLVIGVGEMNYLRNEIIEKNIFNPVFLIIRYIGLLTFVPFVYVLSKYFKSNSTLSEVQKFWPIIGNFIAVFILSHELLTLLYLYQDGIGYQPARREGLSILWGLYSFALVGWGVWKNQKITRLAGMALFGITIIKVFLFDLSSLDVMSRIGLFIGLGILLLLTSYLYQKNNFNNAENNSEKREEKTDL